MSTIVPERRRFYGEAYLGAWVTIETRAVALALAQQRSTTVSGLLRQLIQEASQKAPAVTESEVSDA